VRYLRADLENALGRERRYREESERYAQEANSPDHALAALLATGSAQQTKFRARQRFVFKDTQYLDSEAVATVYAGKGKVAVVVQSRESRHPCLEPGRSAVDAGGWLLAA
jgi:hypothetical protein